MSAVVGEPASAGGQKYVNFDEYVDFQVNKTRSGIRHADLLQAAVTVVLVVAGYLLAFVVADHWLIDGGFAYAPRLIMLLGLAAFIGLWTTFKIVLPYWKRVTALYAARELEQSQPQLKSSLLTLVDLKRAGRNVRPHIISSMEKRAALQLSEIDVDEAVDRRPLMRLAFALLAVVVALCLYTVLSPKPIGASLLRALLPVADVGVATRTRIVDVDPGDTSILARSQLEVTVDLEGEIPAEATLLYSTRDLSLVDEPVVLRDTGEGLHRFRGTLAGPNGRGLLQDFTYHVAAGDAVSETYNVTVAQAPYATVETVTYEYPKYMELDARSQSGGDIDAWEGTQITLSAVTNMPVAGATLRLHDSEDTSIKAEEIPLRVVNETRLELARPWMLEFRSDGTYPHYYSIDVRTSAEQRDPVPRLYGLTIRRDLPPEIKLLHPSGDVVLPLNGVLPIAYTARDPDFMLRSVRMHFEQQDRPLEKLTRHLYDAPPFRSDVAGRAEIDLSNSRFQDLKLQPGDVLTFWLEAWDNMAPLGNRPGNRTVTAKINIAIAAEASDDQVEQQRAQEAAAAQDRLNEAQTQQNSNASDGDSDFTVAPEENPPEGAAGEQPSPDNADAASNDDQQNNSQEQSTSDQSAGGDESGADQQNSSSTGDGGRQANSAEPSPDGKPQQTGDQSQAGNQTKSGNEQGAESSHSNGKSGNQSSPSGAGSRQQRPTSPEQQAADDEALDRLFQEYADDIKRQQQADQQQQPSDQRSGEQGNKGQQSRSGENDGNNSNAQEQSDSDENAGDSTQSNRDPAGDSPSGRNPQSGREPSDSRNGNSPQSESDAPPRDSASPDQDGSSTPNPRTDPRANQDPRTADQDESPRSRKPGDSPPAESDPRPNDAAPMPNPGESSNASESPENQPNSDPNAPGEPTGDQPQGPPSSRTSQSPGSKPGGEPQPNQPGDAGNQSADDQPAADPARTGDQPAGPNESNPGEGRPQGQRSEQPETGERGSSQQSSDGAQSRDQSGEGDASQSPGSKSQGGKPGQSSPGQGQPSGDKPGESQPGGESSASGGNEKAGGDSASSQDPSTGGDSKSASQSGSDSESGNQQPGNGTRPDPAAADQSQPSANESQSGGNKGQSESPNRSQGDEQSGNKPGNNGDKQSDSGKQQSGNDQNGGKQQQDGAKQGGSEKGNGEKSGAEQGGGKQGGAEQGGSEQGGGEQDGGEQGGGEQGGGEQGGGEQGGGEQGGSEQGGGGQSKPSEGGGSPPPGQGHSQATNGNPNGGTGSDNSQVGGAGSGAGPADNGEGAEAANLDDKKRATELVLRKLQDELNRGEVSPELLQDLGWTEDRLRDFMDRLDRRLSDAGEDQSPDSQARRRQFEEILRGIDYASEGNRQAAESRDRPVESGSGVVPRRPAPTEFQKIEDSFRKKLSRETRSK